MREHAESNEADRVGTPARSKWLQGSAFLGLAALVVVGFGLRAWNASQELPELLRTTLPDDAFYYFGIARHITLGNPPSIDGVSPTNGYHPLWLALLVPIYSFLGPDALVTPIRVALLLGAALDTASAVLLWQIARRLGLRIASIAVALVFFALNPHQVVNATCGLETALALFALLLAVALHVRAHTSEPRTVPNTWRWGVILGLAVLARTDNAIVVACLLAVNVWHLWRSAGRRRALTWGASTMAAALAIFSPWPAYSLYTTGTVVQSSGVALSVIHRRMAHVWGFEHPRLTLSAARAGSSVLESADLIIQWWALSGTVAAIVALAALTYLVDPVTWRAFRRRAEPVLPFLVGMMVVFFAHSVVRWVFREWYTAPFIAAGALIAAVLGDMLLAAPRWRVFCRLGVAGAMGVWLWGAANDWRKPIYDQGLAGDRSAHVRQGHSDCGVVSYFTGRGITNLDGIVNQRALEALLVGNLLGYVKSQKFERIILSPHFHSAVWFGRRYRESLVTQEDDGRAVRIATDADKDARIAPTFSDVRLGSPRGREYLSDGWLWNSDVAPTARSVGAESELIFYVPRRSGDITFELELSAAVTDTRDVQPVEVFLNDAPAIRLNVVAAPKFYAIPLRNARQGRNRVRLRFGHTRPMPTPNMDWWRAGEGYPVSAIEGHSLRFLATGKVQAYAAAADALICDGCHPPEKDDQRTWRWTMERASLRLPAFEANVECLLKVVAGAPMGSYRVSWNGALLGGSLGSYRVPADQLGTGPTSQIVIDAPAFVPAERNESSDTRRLGVALESIDVTCR